MSTTQTSQTDATFRFGPTCDHGINAHGVMCSERATTTVVIEILRGFSMGTVAYLQRCDDHSTATHAAAEADDAIGVLYHGPARRNLPRHPLQWRGNPGDRRTSMFYERRITDATDDLMLRIEWEEAHEEHAWDCRRTA